jgi:hypothetical protein
VTPPGRRAAGRRLVPVEYASALASGERHVGFVAEDVPDPVATPDRRSVSPMDVVAVLTRVVQAQPQAIAELTARRAALEAPRASRAAPSGRGRAVSHREAGAARPAAGSAGSGRASARWPGSVSGGAK